MLSGTGLIESACIRPSTGTWIWINSSTGAITSVVNGLSTDLPMLGDFDGDGKADPAIFRPSTGLWFVLRSSTNYTTSFGLAWGTSTDTMTPHVSASNPYFARS